MSLDRRKIFSLQPKYNSDRCKCSRTHRKTAIVLLSASECQIFKKHVVSTKLVKFKLPEKTAAENPVIIIVHSHQLAALRLLVWRLYDEKGVLADQALV